MDLPELRRLIEEAFAGVEYPGDDHIAGCSWSELPQGCDECDGYAEHFKGTRWQDHDKHTLTGCDSAVSLLHQEALHYFLPAFMLADLDDLDGECIPNVQDSIIYGFTPSQNLSRRAEVLAWVKRLTLQQRTAIAGYIRYVRTFEGEFAPERDDQEAIDLLESAG